MVLRWATFSSASFSLSCRSASCEAPSACASSPVQQQKEQVGPLYFQHACPPDTTILHSRVLLYLAIDKAHSVRRGRSQTFSGRLAHRRPLVRERLQLRLHRCQALLCALQIDLLVLQHLQMTAPEASTIN